MARDYFMKTEHVGFSVWTEADEKLAECLWGNPMVTRYICADGVFTPEQIAERLRNEIENRKKYNVQYWPIFDLENGELVGCCGLRPRDKAGYEIGFHLTPTYWGRGLAREAAQAVIEHAFTELKAEYLFAGHNPKNVNSAKVIRSLGFEYLGDEFYAPTGLNHPSYKMCRKNYRGMQK